MDMSLTDHLRHLTDDGLGAFLQLRPDLAVPVPPDLSALAVRAQSRVSVARALDTLDQFTLAVLDGLRLVRAATATAPSGLPSGDPVMVASVDRLLELTAQTGVAAAAVRAALDRLCARGLVFGPDRALHVVAAVDELGSPYPAGLGRPAAELDPAAARLAQDPAGLRRALLGAPPPARAVLDRLAGGPPVGSALRALADHDSPVRWLVDHHLLVPITGDLVELPREVGIVLRRDTGPLGRLHPDPPPLAETLRAGADSAGAGQALDAVRHLDTLLASLADAPAPVLRSSGLGIRELRRLARAAETTEAVAALLLEVGYAAGLLAHTEPIARTSQTHWLPTPGYDSWRAGQLSHRWALLARTWLTMSRAPGLVGLRDDKDRPINALSADTTRLGAPAIRRSTLAVLAELPDNAAAPVEAVLDRLAWQAPRWMGRSTGPGGPAALARSVLVEAAALGVTGLDAVTSYGRLLLAEVPADPNADPLGIRSGDGPRHAPLLASLDALLPPPVDHVLLQADLTIVVPGPPEPLLAAELGMVADAESRGAATVYRVTPVSIRRALDAGHPPADILELFRRRSRTPLPQALQYLVDDVARRHGGLRVGAAGAYLRGQDEALINEVLVDKRLRPLALHRLAPTVLATPYATARLLEALRSAGYVPVPEDATGAAVLTRPKSPRAPGRGELGWPGPRAARPDDADPPLLTGPRLAGIVEEIRRGDRLAQAVRSARRSPATRPPVTADGVPLTTAQAHQQALSVLQQAMREQAMVWVGYVDAHGVAVSRLVRPVSMGAGYLRAEDDRTDTLHTFALHRITSAVPTDDTP